MEAKVEETRPVMMFISRMLAQMVKTMMVKEKSQPVASAWRYYRRREKKKEGGQRACREAGAKPWSNVFIDHTIALSIALALAP